MASFRRGDTVQHRDNAALAGVITDIWLEGNGALIEFAVSSDNRALDLVAGERVTCAPAFLRVVSIPTPPEN